jgi:hypothetical protein
MDLTDTYIASYTRITQFKMLSQSIKIAKTFHLTRFIFNTFLHCQIKTPTCFIAILPCSSSKAALGEMRVRFVRKVISYCSTKHAHQMCIIVSICDFVEGDGIRVLL